VGKQSVWDLGVKSGRGSSGYRRTSNRPETRISGKYKRKGETNSSGKSLPPTLHRIPGRYSSHPEISGIGTKTRQSGTFGVCGFPQVQPPRHRSHLW